MDAEDFRQVILDYQQVAEQVIRRYGGHVAQYLGDGLLVYFGYPKGLEDAPKAGIGKSRLVASFEGQVKQEPNAAPLEDTNGRLTNYKGGIFSNGVSSIMEDGDGNLWFGIWGGGLTRYDGQQFTFFTIEEGLSNSYIRSVLQDNSTNIWVSTKKGISVLIPPFEGSTPNGGSSSDGYQCYIYGQEDGLKTMNFAWNSAAIDRHNRIWWGGFTGLTIQDINHLTLPSAPPEISLYTIDIQETIIDYRRLSDTEYRQGLLFGQGLKGKVDSVAAFYNYPAKMTLPHDLNHLTFYFSAID